MGAGAAIPPEVSAVTLVAVGGAAIPPVAGAVTLVAVYAGSGRSQDWSKVDSVSAKTETISERRLSCVRLKDCVGPRLSRSGDLVVALEANS